MDIIVYLLYFTSLFLSDLTAQELCNSNIEVAPCGAAEICRFGTCERAVPCTHGARCTELPGTQCRSISDYCQPPTCTATGQCVTGQVCSQNRMRSCVYPVILSAEEGFNLTLNFAETATSETYDVITWYKGSTGSSDMIVYLDPVATGGEPLFYGVYCSDSIGPCEMSEKGSLDKTSGNMTINKVVLSDQGFYYYKFYTRNNPDTGHEYEYLLEVQVIPESDNILLDGANEIIEPGTNLTLTCTVSRIKPKAVYFFFSMDGDRYNATTTTTNNTDSTIKQVATFFMGIEETDHGKAIKCVVDHVNGQRIEKQAILNVRVTSPGVDTGLIIGLTVGGVVLIAAVSGLVFFIRRYDIDLKLSKKKKSVPKKPTNSQAGVYENCQLGSKPRKEEPHEYAQPYTQGTTISSIYHQAKLPNDETPVGLYEDVKEDEMIGFNAKKGKVNRGMAMYQN